MAMLLWMVLLMVWLYLIPVRFITLSVLPRVLVCCSARLLLQGLPGHWRPCNAFYSLW